MPIYEYRCSEGHQFEVFQAMADDPVTVCEVCGKPVERVFSPVAVHYKGSGFYTTDYAKKGSAKSSSSSDSGSSSSDSESDSGSKSDSSPLESKSSSSSTRQLGLVRLAPAALRRQPFFAGWGGWLGSPATAPEARSSGDFGSTLSH